MIKNQEQAIRRTLQPIYRYYFDKFDEIEYDWERFDDFFRNIQLENKV